MMRGKYRTGWWMVALLATALTLPVPSLAQRVAAFRPPQARRPVLVAQAQRPQAPRQPPGHSQQPRGHVGDWLRHYKDVPPAEQERELQSDPAFRRLPA